MLTSNILISWGQQKGIHSCITAPRATHQHYNFSIPRDTRVAIKGHNQDKINHAMAYGGIPLILDSVENLLNIKIDHYVKVNFDGFINVIDALGGVNIEVPCRMYKPLEAIDLLPGYQTLSGSADSQQIDTIRSHLFDTHIRFNTVHHCTGYTQSLFHAHFPHFSRTGACGNCQWRRRWDFCGTGGFHGAVKRVKTTIFEGDETMAPCSHNSLPTKLYVWISSEPIPNKLTP